MTTAMALLASTFLLVLALLTMKFQPGSRARKVGGSYQATGTIRAAFLARDGSPRYVFDFDQPPGLLHIAGFGGTLRREQWDTHTLLASTTPRLVLRFAT